MVLIGLVGVVIFGLGMVATAGALLFVGQRNVETVQVEGISDDGDDSDPVEVPDSTEEDEEPDVDEITDVLNVLLVGSDRRDNLSPEQQAELGTGDDDGDRTDTIMLLRLDPNSDEMHILSFPRDLLVTRCDGSRGKINHAYHIGEEAGTGGASCLVQTISDFSGLSIQHFVQVDFAGFMDVVDVVDGVPVYLEHPVDDWRANLDLEAGCHRLDGVEALGFVRTRKYDSDYGRIARQQQFIRQLVDEASSLSTVLNVPRLFSLVETGASAVTTDQNLSLDKMRRLAFSLRDLAGDNVVARTVPAEFEMIDDIWYEIPIEHRAQQLFDAFSAGMLTEDEEDSVDPTLVVADVPSVTVLNASDTGGLAGSAADALSAHGFTIAAIDNSPEDVTGVGEVRYPPHKSAEAELLASYLPGVETVAVDGSTELQLLLGPDADPDEFGPPEDDDADPGEGDTAGVPGDESDPAEDDPRSAEDPDDAVSAPPPLVEEEYVGAQPPPPECDF